MHNDSNNQIDKPKISNDSNEPINAPPIAQPYVPQPILAQLTNQPYIPHIFNQPFIIQPFVQPYLNKQIIPQYIIQPTTQTYSQLYAFQPNVPVVENSNYLKKKFFCPKFWTWFMFAFSLLDILIHLINNRLPVVGVISCITFFIVAFLVDQSSENNDKKKYTKAFYLFLICFVLGCITFIYLLFIRRIWSRRIRKILGFMYIFEIIFGLITLSVLRQLKREFDKIPNPEIQKLVSPQEL